MRALWIGGEGRESRANLNDDAGKPGVPVEVVRVSELSTGLTQLADGGIDVVLLETARRLEVLDALTALHSRAPEVPVVVLTAPDDDATGEDAVQHGAQDWLAASQADGAVLTRALRYAIERHRLQRTLRELSLTDDLTGLYNRRGFVTLGDHHLKLARRTRGLLLARADITGLRAINTRFGYQEGDRALQATAEILRASFRVSDVVARLSADEFAVLALDAADETAEVIAPRLRARVAEHNEHPDTRYALDLRIGIARCAREETPTIEDLLARAAIALGDEKR